MDRASFEFIGIVVKTVRRRGDCIGSVTISAALDAPGSTGRYSVAIHDASILDRLVRLSKPGTRVRLKGVIHAGQREDARPKRARFVVDAAGELDVLEDPRE